ncbi:MAG TPA: EAL domain-containing protein [Conexibacter sp.]|nr:EAL domain-containing protein [Conexibacter sp.]
MTTTFAARDVDEVLASAERLDVLRRSGLMDSARDDDLGRWAHGAAEALDAALAIVSLVDERRQLVKAVVGATGADAARELPLTRSFCRYVVGEGRPLAVGDARSHALLSGNGAVTDLGVVAYAGAPIVVSGQPLGALCVIDGEPRDWSDADLRLLAHLAAGLAHEIELRMATVLFAGRDRRDVEVDVTGASRRRALEHGLRHAIEREELSVVYQPLQRFGDGQVCGVEALLRWKNDELGSVSPDEFIPIAEQSGLIHELGAWALRTACAAMPALVRAHGPAVFLAVNVSPRQLRAPALPLLVAAALAEHGISPDRLWIEITETALLGEDPETARSVAALHEMGARIALDDFGTGCSSLAALKQHPIGAIKIDRSFVDGVVEHRDDRAIVTALVAMGRSLGLRVVAEGVETREQHELLRRLGCDYGQGYLIGRPAPAA